MEALKMWNSQREKWTIPKKGTDDYKEVRALMDGEKPKLKHTKKKDKPTEKPKRKRGRPKKVVV